MHTLPLLRTFLFAVVAFSFPIAALAVFGYGVDRGQAANVVSVIYGVGLFLAIFASLFPLKSLRDWTLFQRVESLVLVYLGMSYITHLSWELGWLLGHDWIIANRDSPLTYLWWAYIDGGDARYATVEPTLLVMEILSVCNGMLGMCALWLFFRSNRTSKLAVLLMVVTASVHLYSASLYYLTEILFGLPNVGTGFIARWIKFGLANLPWVICPWLVFWWAYQKLTFT